MTDQAPRNSHSLPASDPQPESNGPSQQQGEEEASQRRTSQAAAEAMLMGMSSRGATQRSLRGCKLYAWLIVGVVWVLIAVMVWLDPPNRITYAPVVTGAAGTTVGLPKGWVITIPPGWSSRRSTTFSGPRGEVLGVQHSTVKTMHMAPRTVTGVPVAGRYTAVAYGQGLKKRISRVKQIAWTRYIALGDQEGVEACVLLADGKCVRSFALVGRDMSVLELRFLLPGAGPNNVWWQEAEGIFRTLRRGRASDLKPATTPSQRGEAETEE